MVTWGLAISGIPLKIFSFFFSLKTTRGAFFFWGGRGKMERRERKKKKTGKKNQSTIQWYIPNFCHSAQVVPSPHSKVHGPLGLSEEQQLGSACPRSRSFSLKWQQWAYPVQGQCWSSWDVGCYSKTCILDWVQRAAGWELEPSDYNNWSRIHSHNSLR